MKNNITIQDVLLIDMNMDSNDDMRSNDSYIRTLLLIHNNKRSTPHINKRSTTHNNSNTNTNKKVLLMMERGEGECFYC